MKWKSPKFERHKQLTLASASSGADDAQRVYRNQIALFGQMFSPCEVSPIGLLHARAHAVSFSYVPFLMRWGRRRLEETAEVLAGMRGVAVMPLVQGMLVSREEAVELARVSILRHLPLVREAIIQGPSSPGKLTDGHRALAAEWEGAFVESVGTSWEAPGARAYFLTVFEGGVMSRLRLTVELAHALR